MIMAKITVENILKLRKSYEDYYAVLHEQQKEIDDYYELVFKTDIPSDLGYQEIIPPTAREWVEVGVRNYTLDNPKAVILPRGDSDTARRKDALVESLWTFWLRRIIREIKDGAKKLLLRGEVFYKVWMDDIYFGVDISKLTESERVEFEEKRLFHFPLGVKVPDPINVFCSPAHNGLVPVNVIESYNITVAEAQNMCAKNNWGWKTDKKATDKVKWTSYYSADERCFLLEDEPVLKPVVQPNILKLCPYVHIDGGFGHSSYEGKPEYLYRSIIYPEKAMLKMQARGLSQADAMNARYAWPRPEIEGEEEDVQKLYPNPKVDLFSPNAIIRSTERVKVKFTEGMSVPPSVFQMLGQATNLTQPPEVLSGIRPAGVYSAQGVDTLKASAKPRYKDAFKNNENGLAVLMGMGAKIIDTVYQHPVAIRDMSVERTREQKIVKPEDIDGHYDCEVKLLAEPPEATEMRKVSGNNSQKAGVISHLTNLRMYHDMSLEEALDEQAQILAEKAMNQPGSLEFATRDAMVKFGMEEEEAEIAAQKKASKFPPPRREPEILGSAYEQVRKRGRSSPGLEASPTPGEVRAGGA